MFKIATAASSNFSDVLKLCLPSWYKNSGTQDIEVYSFQNRSDEEGVKGWYANASYRCQIMRDVVCQSAERKEKLLFMDIDCFVLKDLSGGFSEDKPISIARWPNVNMGVIFFNLTLDWDAISFMDTLTASILERCEKYRKKPLRKFKPGDQNVWQESLHLNEHLVNKLGKEWNFDITGDRCVWKRELKKVGKENVRILHIKTRHYGLKSPVVSFMRKDFPNVFHNS